MAVRMKDKLRITGMEHLYFGINKHKIFVKHLKLFVLNKINQ